MNEFSGDQEEHPTSQLRLAKRPNNGSEVAEREGGLLDCSRYDRVHGVEERSSSKWVGPGALYLSIELALDIWIEIARASTNLKPGTIRIRSSCTASPASGTCDGKERCPRGSTVTT